MIKLISGNASLDLATNVANLLDMPMTKTDVSRFGDGEIRIEIQEKIRGAETFIIQSICAPCNDNLMELILLADALRRSSAKSITAVVPYLGYARQDRRVNTERVPISAKVVADMMQAVGINRMITVDLHSDQIQGFYYMPVDNIYTTQLFIKSIKSTYTHTAMIVSPDVGGIMRARAVAKHINSTNLAVVDKVREKSGQAESLHVIGDIADKDCIIIDDMIDTANTLCSAAKILKQHGAKTVSAYCTHPVLSGMANSLISSSCLDKVYVTDSIPLSNTAINSNKIHVLALAPLLVNAITRVSSIN